MSASTVTMPGGGSQELRRRRPGHRAEPAAGAANPQAPALNALQPARRAGDDGQLRMGDLRCDSRELVDIGRRRPRRHRIHRTDESRCRRFVSAAIPAQRVGVAGDPATDVLATAGAVDARQVLPLRRSARRRRTLPGRFGIWLLSCRWSATPSPVSARRRAPTCSSGRPSPPRSRSWS